jgi:hypothetical protein
MDPIVIFCLIYICNPINGIKFILQFNFHPFMYANFLSPTHKPFPYTYL